MSDLKDLQDFIGGVGRIGFTYCVDGKQKTEGMVSDGELDPLELTFVDDGTLHIKTEDYAYISLDEQTLKELLKMFVKVKKDLKGEIEL